MEAMHMNKYFWDCDREVERSTLNSSTFIAAFVSGWLSP